MPFVAAAGVAGMLGLQQEQGLFNGQQQMLGQGHQLGSGGYSEQAYAQIQQHQELQRLKALAERNAAKIIPTPKTETTMANEKELLPDISIVRVLKWAVVLFIAMGLGKRVWDTFGHKIAAKIESQLKDIL